LLLHPKHGCTSHVTRRTGYREKLNRPNQQTSGNPCRAGCLTFLPASDLFRRCAVLDTFPRFLHPRLYNTNPSKQYNHGCRNRRLPDRCSCRTSCLFPIRLQRRGLQFLRSPLQFLRFCAPDLRQHFYLITFFAAPFAEVHQFSKSDYSDIVQLLLLRLFRIQFLPVNIFLF